MSESKRPADPFAMWKPFQDAWAKTMNEVVGSEEFARAMGQSMETYLETVGPLREQVEKGVERSLSELHLPTRGDLEGLAERLTNIELRLDDLDAKLDAALSHLETIRAGTVGAGLAPARPPPAPVGQSAGKRA